MEQDDHSSGEVQQLITLQSSNVSRRYRCCCGDEHTGARRAEEDGIDNRSVDDDLSLIAHRVFAGQYPENTVSAAEYASQGSE